MITIFINGVQIEVNKNLTVLQACNTVKLDIPKFCFQKNLQIAGNCRMCLVEIENSPKPVASCAMPLMNNMKIFTNTPLVQKARESVLEFLLINHPLDCPICDQASECDLQDQTLIYGSDKSRFFFKKRIVEDKYCGPFIKTIMTRCIHCTRCVRFANDICGIDNLGTTGRGNNTEINFYNSNIFYSDFSGNLIDLCPVGALTSKPFAFKVRSWELKKKEGIDILDAIGSNIKIDVFNNEIIRILPKTNFNINKEWISNKTRFFFDSLKYQRITYPLLKNKKNQFEKISWIKAFSILNNKLITTDASNIKTIVGDLIDLESLFLLKKNINKIGSLNITSENLFLDKLDTLNGDLTSNFLFNSKIKNINECDVCLIINSNIESEASILNIHLINRFKKGNFNVSYIGNNVKTIFPSTHLGTDFSILISILSGKHFFCKKLKKAKNPIIIFGENCINLKNSYFIYKFFNTLSFLKSNNINWLFSKTSIINFLEISFPKNNNKFKNFDLLFLFNTNNILKNILLNKFIIYQGHHFTYDAQNSNLLLPGLTFLEKQGTYINIEGIIQKNLKILNLNTEQRADSIIYKYIYKYLIDKNQKIIQQNKPFLLFNELLPYLLKKNLKNININILKKKKLTLNMFFLTSLNKNYYYSNILEQYSKILINSKKILRTNNNFTQIQ